MLTTVANTIVVTVTKPKCTANLKYSFKVSFLSPCVLPIVPGYLSIITGLDITEVDKAVALESRYRGSVSWKPLRDALAGQ